jgi:hypothetical protein
MSCFGGLSVRLFTRQPIPASINYLSSGFAPVSIERMDDRTTVVTAEGGYTPLPGDITDDATGLVTPSGLENIYRTLDGLNYNPRNPMRGGQAVAVCDVTAEVAKMTGDGRIAQARFTFARSLEDERYARLLWDEAASTYERVRMPAIGESRVYP